MASKSASVISLIEGVSDALADRIAGAKSLELQHLGRAMGRLGPVHPKGDLLDLVVAGAALDD